MNKKIEPNKPLRPITTSGDYTEALAYIGDCLIYLADTLDSRTKR